VIVEAGSVETIAHHYNCSALPGGQVFPTDPVPPCTCPTVHQMHEDFKKNWAAGTQYGPFKQATYSADKPDLHQIGLSIAELPEVIVKWDRNVPFGGYSAPHYGQDGPCGPVNESVPVEALRIHRIACPHCCNPEIVGGCTTSVILERRIWDKDFGTDSPAT
jgi:hypothetical protein